MRACLLLCIVAVERNSSKTMDCHAADQSGHSVHACNAHKLHAVSPSEHLFEKAPRPLDDFTLPGTG